MRAVRFLLAALLVLGGFVSVGVLPSEAHESRPVFVDLREAEENVISLRWRVPPTVDGDNIPVPLLSPECTIAEQPRYREEAGSVVGQVLLTCEGGLAGRTLQVVYPKYNPVLTAVLRVQFADGQSVTESVGPNDPAWEIPAAQTLTGILFTYAELGTAHIWEGYDHLLFVACLIFIAGSWQRILMVITGFTVAHSITLALSALRLIYIPITPTEAVIALSIVLLAMELARQDRSSLTWRYPLLVSVCFGLLHGLGFASALKEIGLPDQDVLVALFSFNIGVEIGQVLFALVVIALMRGLTVLGSTLPPLRPIGEVSFQAQLVAYIAGPLASYWLIERVAGF